MPATSKIAGVKLVECRKRRLLSQAQLAAKAGVAPATVYKLERGLHKPQARIAARLAEALEVDPAEVDEFRAVMGLE